MKKFERSGIFLSNFRELGGLTQDELSKKLGVHAQYISNAERGLCLLPAKALKKLGRMANKNYLLSEVLADLEKYNANKYSRILAR